MQKKQGQGNIVALEIPDALQQYNVANKVTRARLVFSFIGTQSTDENDLTAQLLNRVGNNTYSVIIDITDIGLQKAVALFVGKQATFTVYSFSVLELTENNFAIINNGEREYSSLSSPHIGNMTDDNVAFNTLRNRLSKDLESGRLILGKLPQQPPTQQPPQQGGQQQPPQNGQTPPQNGQWGGQMPPQGNTPPQQGGYPY